MILAHPKVDPLYRAFAELLLRRHRLLLEGNGDDAEIDEVEEGLSALWEKLTEGQRQSLNGVGSDLNWVRRGGSPPPKGRQREEVTEEDRRHLAEAESAKDWHAVLHYLRACAPEMDVANLASRRAAAYAGIGLPEYEAVCHEAASK
jgi:hypothetical protein